MVHSDLGLNFRGQSNFQTHQDYAKTYLNFICSIQIQAELEDIFYAKIKRFRV